MQLLENVQELHVGKNDVDTLDVGFMCKLRCLHSLFADHNLLEKIPDELPATLETLVLASNKVREVPSSLSRLSRLETLSLEYNPLFCAFPSDALRSLTKLRSVSYTHLTLPTTPYV